MTHTFNLSKKNLLLALLAFVQFGVISCKKETPEPPPPASGGTGGGSGGGGGAGSTVPTVTEPNTYFIDEYRTVNGNGAWWVQEFTVSGTSTFVLRAASTYTADFAVFSPSQLINFQTNAGFSAFVLFDNKYGTANVTLGPGTYYVGFRNQSTGTNSARIELDKDLVLPASDKCTYVDNYLNAASNINPNNGYLTQAFTVQTGYRYFMDGCNSADITYWVIPAAEINKFTSGATFQYYTQYTSSSTADPGAHSMTLPAGNYYYVFRNTGTVKQSLTYRCERWKVN